jgi:flagellar biosynthesis protein FlhG
MATVTTRPARTIHPASDTPSRNVITVASGKGGVGKTWFSITLAHTLAKLGKRVLLFDGDLGLANVDIQLGLSVDHDLSEVVAGRRELAGCVTKFAAGGFDIVAGQSGSGSLATLPAQKVAMLREALSVLAARYDMAILDLSAGLEPALRLMTPEHGVCLVITTDEPTSLTDAYAFIKVAKGRAPGADMRVVVNMAETTTAGLQTYATLLKACETFLRTSPPLVGVVRRDAKVRASIRNQTPLIIRHPNSDAAVDVEDIARNLIRAPS